MPAAEKVQRVRAARGGYGESTSERHSGRNARPLTLFSGLPTGVRGRPRGSASLSPQAKSTRPGLACGCARTRAPHRFRCCLSVRRRPGLHQQMQPKPTKRKEKIMSTTKTLTQADLDRFTGTETWWRRALVRNILFTDGAEHVADAAGAYWLIDEIAFAQGESRALRPRRFSIGS